MGTRNHENEDAPERTLTAAPLELAFWQLPTLKSSYYGLENSILAIPRDQSVSSSC